MASQLDKITQQCKIRFTLCCKLLKINKKAHEHDPQTGITRQHKLITSVHASQCPHWFSLKIKSLLINNAIYQMSSFKWSVLQKSTCGIHTHVIYIVLCITNYWWWPWSVIQCSQPQQVIYLLTNLVQSKLMVFKPSYII